MVMLPNKLHYFVLQIELRIPLAPISNIIKKTKKESHNYESRNLIEIQYLLLDMLLSSQLLAYYQYKH